MYSQLLVSFCYAVPSQKYRLKLLAVWAVLPAIPATMLIITPTGHCHKWARPALWKAAAAGVGPTLPLAENMP